MGNHSHVHPHEYRSHHIDGRGAYNIMAVVCHRLVSTFAISTLLNVIHLDSNFAVYVHCMPSSPVMSP